MMRFGFISSILTPWATVRKVKVDIEVVRPPNPGPYSLSNFDCPGSLRRK